MGIKEKPRNKRLAPLGSWACMGFGSDDDKTKLAENIGASDYLLFIHCNQNLRVNPVYSLSLDRPRSCSVRYRNQSGYNRGRVMTWRPTPAG
jgi:hypothetical protein